MSMGKHSARVGAAAGAAALALGLSVAGVPGSIAVGAADSPDTMSAGAEDSPSRNTRVTRGVKDSNRVGQSDSTIRGSDSVAPSAVKGTAPRGQAIADAEADTDRTARPTAPDARPSIAEQTATPAVAEPSAARSPIAAAPVTATPVEPADSFAVPVPVPRSVSLSVPVSVPATAIPTATPDRPIPAPPEFAGAPPAVNAPPRALATVATPAGAAASSFADVLGDLLGPIQAFIDGAALLVRRTLFNEAPTVSPVQLTGQTEGPITGTIGAVDPEDDPLTFTISGSPRFGTVAVNRDGGYTYTPGPAFAGTDSFSVTATDTGFHINLLDPFRPAGTSASVSVARGAVRPALRFQFVYGAGSQFWSPSARAALESAATQLGSYLVVSSPVTVTYQVNGEFSPLSATLAEAGSSFASPGPGFLDTVVQNKIQTGADANGSTPDGTISVNFGQPWSLGSPVAGNQYDLESIAMHELLHTLGFLSYVQQAGANTGQTWTVYDSFLVNSAGNRIIGPDYLWSSAYNPNLTGANRGVYFSGPNAVAANNGLVPLYTPNPWVSGSSLSHLSDYVFTGSKDTLMTAVVSRGPAPRALSAVELGILRDLGYTVAPGPGGATLMFVGVLFLRRLRQNGAVEPR
jgi:hypothetical protein